MCLASRLKFDLLVSLPKRRGFGHFWYVGLLCSLQNVFALADPSHSRKCKETRIRTVAHACFVPRALAVFACCWDVLTNAQAASLRSGQSIVHLVGLDIQSLPVGG